MIVKGEFMNLTLAVLGSHQPPVTDSVAYSPALTPISIPSHSPLPVALDPASSAEPTALGQSLLDMTFEPPGLAQATKFALAHDPFDVEPDESAYTDLRTVLDSTELGANWLREAAHATRRPITEHVGEDNLRAFGKRVQDCLYDRTNGLQRTVAKLLFHISRQSSAVVSVFLVRRSALAAHR